LPTPVQRSRALATSNQAQRHDHAARCGAAPVAALEQRGRLVAGRGGEHGLGGAAASAGAVPVPEPVDRPTERAAG
jgi:hypothetical protein